MRRCGIAALESLLGTGEMQTPTMDGEDMGRKDACLEANGQWARRYGRKHQWRCRINNAKAWQMADGRRQMADGRWQMADGRWQMVDGRWQMADGLMLEKSAYRVE
ncbi:hypothetical protein B0T17DRAFT_512753 [Bombardia bombarda]|uniref:Uncharacterized protein n=1 Tax=Bombardia bombarda TaxID=252184 RepID=A0AA39TG29_9PEZI|nr:hypothetical protein B0T17DRAFT_512753 [Bombardia bombarda]